MKGFSNPDCTAFEARKVDLESVKNEFIGIMKVSCKELIGCMNTIDDIAEKVKEKMASVRRTHKIGKASDLALKMGILFGFNYITYGLPLCQVCTSILYCQVCTKQIVVTLLF